MWCLQLFLRGFPILEKNPHIIAKLEFSFCPQNFRARPVEFRSLTVEITPCSLCVLVSAVLLFRATDKVVLQVVEYRGVDFSQLIATVVRHNLDD